MKIPRKSVNALFAALDMPVAAKWPPKRMADKLSKISDVVDEDTDVGDSKKLLDAILKAQAKGIAIEIVEDVEDDNTTVEDEAPAPKKSSKKAKAAPVEEEEDEEEEEAPAPAKASKKKAVAKKAAAEEEEEEEAPAPKKGSVPKKSPAKKADKESKGPGVIASIVEFLSKANAKKPLTKDDLCAKLAERFPDREAESMMRTINVQVPNRLRVDKDLDVQKNEKGYWVNA